MNLDYYNALNYMKFVDLFIRQVFVIISLKASHFRILATYRTQCLNLMAHLFYPCRLALSILDWTMVLLEVPSLMPHSIMLQKLVYVMLLVFMSPKKLENHNFFNKNEARGVLLGFAGLDVSMYLSASQSRTHCKNSLFHLVMIFIKIINAQYYFA